MTTIGEALDQATQRLASAGCDSPRNDAQILAAHLLGCGTMDLGLRRRDELPSKMAEFASLVERRAAREPLQHILGVAWFGPLELAVGPGVFIPRPETEVLADWAVRQAQRADAPVVVDLCTGSGAIAAHVAHEVPSAQVYAVELSDDALVWTRKNVPSTVTVVKADVTDPALLSQLAGEVDVVVSNPPYVPETLDLSPEVYHDPHMAVFSGADGMELIPRMLPNCATLLKSGGAVGIEHDDTTSQAVMDAVQETGHFVDIAPLADFTGRHRFVTARRV